MECVFPSSRQPIKYGLEYQTQNNFDKSRPYTCQTSNTMLIFISYYYEKIAQSSFIQFSYWNGKMIETESKDGKGRKTKQKCRNSQTRTMRDSKVYIICMQVMWKEPQSVLCSPHIARRSLNSPREAQLQSDTSSVTTPVKAFSALYLLINCSLAWGFQQSTNENFNNSSNATRINIVYLLLWPFEKH